MDSLPIDFYERVTACFYSNSFPACTKISGFFGAFARRTFDNLWRNTIVIQDGRITRNYVFPYHRTIFEKLENRQKKYLKNVIVHIHAGDEEYSARSAAALQQISEYLSDKSTVLVLHTTNLSAEIEKFIGSLRSINLLEFSTTVTRQMEKILTKLVDKKILNYLHFHGKQQFSPEMTDLVTKLMRQDQAFCLEMHDNWKLEDVVAFWEENCEKLAGKQVWFEEKSRDFGLFGFQQCGEREERYFDRRFPFVKSNWSATVDVFVLRNKNERAMYLVIDAAQRMENLVMFD